MRERSTTRVNQFALGIASMFLMLSCAGTAKEEPAKVLQQSSSHVFIFKSDGSKQCGMGNAIPVAEMAKELSGVKVFSQKSGHDGMMHAAVCGGTTGKINIYEIDTQDLMKAKERGFSPLKGQ